ncbi:MAG TPA: divergent polysaccharide deacetylase family protein [Elusimicrobiota bacterium]|nr:divergent polysaccharide deacetylase family protein [Elusimicrobiota bacterium]
MKTRSLAWLGTLALLAAPSFAAESGASAGAPAGTARKAPKIAVVIDDFGLTYPKDVPDEEWMKLQLPMTYADMPVSPRTTKVAEEIKASGHELIIHYPFDKYQKLELPKDRVSESDLKSVTALLDKAFKQIPGPAGLNNHQSLRGTANRPMMEAFMKLLKPHGIYFLDSRVGPKSVAYDEARKAGIPAAVNGIFLDGSREPKARHSKDPAALPAAIAKDKAVCIHWLRYSAAQARKNGSAVAIGHHYYHGTYECLVEEMPKLQAEGIEFVFASALAR